MRVYGERDTSPQQRIRDKDRRRAACHRFYTNMKWEHAQNYHITVNSGVLGIEKCVEIIKSLYQCLVLSLIGCAFTGCCKRA